MNNNEKKDITLGSGENMVCPIRHSLDIIGGKWKLPIICMLAEGNPARYSSIKRKLTGITNMMLAQSLKDLESMGMVNREQYNEIPPRVEYTLTDEGKSIIPALLKLAQWGETHLKSSDSSSRSYCETCQSIK